MHSHFDLNSSSVALICYMFLANILQVKCNEKVTCEILEGNTNKDSGVPRTEVPHPQDVLYMSAK